MASEQGRRRDRQYPLVEQQIGVNLGPTCDAEAQRCIVLVAPEIDQVPRGTQAQFDVGFGSHEFGQSRYEPTRGEPRQRVDSQCAFVGLRGSPKRVLDRLEVRRDFAMQALPCHGEFDTAGTALEQLDVP